MQHAAMNARAKAPASAPRARAAFSSRVAPVAQRSVALKATKAEMPAALLFDCDGVLVDTERDGHRPSFNEAFKRKGGSWGTQRCCCCCSLQLLLCAARIALHRHCIQHTITGPVKSLCAGGRTAILLSKNAAAYCPTMPPRFPKRQVAAAPAPTPNKYFKTFIFKLESKPQGLTTRGAWSCTASCSKSAAAKSA